MGDGAAGPSGIWWLPVYHVLDRGDRQEPIVHSDGDRAAFIRTLGEACERTGWRVHAFVLMSNHYHLLIDTPQPNLVAGMRWFQTTWTVRFNRYHHLSGHVFKGGIKQSWLIRKSGDISSR